jgi:GNAT superfamily N-acetyltransferase
MSSIVLRHAGEADAETLGRLHALSWRSAYRGILADAFLAGPVLADRLSVWQRRLAVAAPASQLVVLACEGEVALGFVCVLLDAEPPGPLLDNLHVLPQARGSGLGRRLFLRAARWVAERRPGAPMHLWVYSRNRAARAFYDKLGGVLDGRWRKTAPDGRRLLILRYSWIEPGALADRAASPQAATLLL